MFRLLSLVAFVIPLFLAVSCSNSDTYSEFRDISAKGWNRYDTLSFSTSLTDAKSYNISLLSRNRADYPYQNVWFFVSCVQDSTTLFSDTVQIELADKMGKWYGSGWGSLFELTTPYKSGIRFPRSKKPYIIRIVQGMRDYDLKGMESVGIHIQPVN